MVRTGLRVIVEGDMSHLLLLGLAEKGGLLVLGGDCIIKSAKVPHIFDPRGRN